jgi:hypothetical protein
VHGTQPIRHSCCFWTPLLKTLLLMRMTNSAFRKCLPPFSSEFYIYSCPTQTPQTLNYIIIISRDDFVGAINNFSMRLTKLTSLNGVLHDKLTVICLLRGIPCFLLKQEIHYTIHQSSPRLPIQIQINPVHTVTPILLTPILILSSLSLVPQDALSP